MWTYCTVLISLSSIFMDEAVSSVVSEEHVLGSTVEIDCQINATNLYWKCPNGGKTIYEDSNSVEDCPYKFGSKLTIMNIRMDDQGIYECVDNDTTVKQFNITLPAVLSSSSLSYYRNLEIDSIGHRLIVGSMNRITVFDLSSEPFPEKTVSTEIRSTTSYVNDCKLSHTVTPYCQNHFRILGKKSDDVYLVCGTNGNRPTGYEFNVENGSYAETGDVPCSNDPFHNCTAVYVGKNNSDDKSYMYYGSIYYSDKTIQRPVYKSDSIEYMKGVDSNRWFQEPEFVGSFDLNDEVLFFFREKAIEVDPTSNKIYSRVAKVCKKDVGGNTQLRNKWTSYQKARLVCSITGDYPFYFDLIQDVKTADGKTFYGLFTSGTTDLSDSAICAFSITDIEAATKGSFKDQTSSNSYWRPVDPNLSPRPGQCVENSLSLSDATLEFIAGKPLMDKPVTPQADKPLFVLDQEQLQKLELHRNMTELVFYVASNRGNVYKLFLKDSVMYSLSNYSVVESPDQSTVVWSLRQYGEYVFVGSDNFIKQIKVINCEQYSWTDTCVKDPHCVWINNSGIIPLDGNQCRNRCRSLSYVIENGYINENGIYTHKNTDITKTTPIACPPSAPSSLRSIRASEDTIDIEWISGDDGGFTQSFSIEFRQDSENSVWTTQNDDKSSRAVSNSLCRCIIDKSLSPGTTYELRVLSRNMMGSSPYTSSIVVSTKWSQNSPKTSEAEGQTSYILIGVAVFLLIIAVIISIISRKRLKDKDGEIHQIENGLKEFANSPNLDQKISHDMNEFIKSLMDKKTRVV